MDSSKLDAEMLQVLEAHKVELLEHRKSLTDQIADLLRSTSEPDAVASLQKRREDVDARLASETGLILSYIQTRYGEWQRLKHRIGLPDGHKDFELLEEDPVNRSIWVEKVAAIEGSLEAWREIYLLRSGRHVGPPGTRMECKDELGRPISFHTFGSDCVGDALYTDYFDDMDSELSELEASFLRR